MYIKGEALEAGESFAYPKVLAIARYTYLHRHDGALDCHVMNCSVLAPYCEAFNLSSEGHLPTNA